MCVDNRTKTLFDMFTCLTARWIGTTKLCHSPWGWNHTRARTAGWLVIVLCVHINSISALVCCLRYKHKYVVCCACCSTLRGNGLLEAVEHICQYIVSSKFKIIYHHMRNCDICFRLPCLAFFFKLNTDTFLLYIKWNENILLAHTRKKKGLIVCTEQSFVFVPNVW